MDLKPRRGFFKKIARNTCNTISKNYNQRTQHNIQESGISNKIGYPCDKLYHNFLQDQITWDEKYLGQGEGELFTCHHCSGILQE